MLELLDHVVLRVAARWYHFGLALGVEDYLLEDIKATERGEVEACCTDMLKRWLRGERATGGKERSWSTVLGAAWKCLERETALLGHCSQHSELCCVFLLNKRGGGGDWVMILILVFSEDFVIAL